MISSASGGAARLRLGHITYSNCFPVHARLLERPEPGDPALVPGIPSELNQRLAAGEIDVAPCSSIEFARHADRYLVLPELVIGARGAVQSIVFLSRTAPERLDGRCVALPTASATSVVLLEILLHERWRAAPRFRWFDQAREDPFAGGADAALFIGDVALDPRLHPDLPVRLDLGAEWYELTGLPFAFAVWQANTDDVAALGELHTRLLASRDYAASRLGCLAARNTVRFGMPAAELEQYWRRLCYTLDDEMLEGLDAFYRLARQIGELDAAPQLRWA